MDLGKEKKKAGFTDFPAWLIPLRLIQYGEIEAGFALIIGGKLYHYSFSFYFPAPVIQDGLNPLP